MKNIKKQIPNIITSLNLFAGCLSCVFSFQGDFMLGVYLILAAAVLDFFDGFAARLLNAYSPLGKELDSLADMVSFGLAPAVMLYSFLSEINSYFAFIAFLIPVFSAFRLAKFNIDERQTSSFIGLATPANAIFWIFAVVNFASSGLYLTMENDDMPFFYFSVSLLVIFFCFLMISEIPMFSLKFKSYAWKSNEIRYLFLLLSLLLIVLLQITAFPLIIVLYIIMSSFSMIFKGKER